MDRDMEWSVGWHIGRAIYYAARMLCPCPWCKEGKLRVSVRYFRPYRSFIRGQWYDGHAGLHW